MTKVFGNKYLQQMNSLNTRNFLKWTSIAISIENPKLNKSICMKMAIKELNKEKKMRNYIRVCSLSLQKNNENMTKSESILKAIHLWKIE